MAIVAQAIAAVANQQAAPTLLRLSSSRSSRASSSTLGDAWPLGKSLGLSRTPSTDSVDSLDSQAKRKSSLGLRFRLSSVFTRSNHADVGPPVHQPPPGGRTTANSDADADEDAWATAEWADGLWLANFKRYADAGVPETNAQEEERVDAGLNI